MRGIITSRAAVIIKLKFPTKFLGSLYLLSSFSVSSAKTTVLASSSLPTATMESSGKCAGDGAPVATEIPREFEIHGQLIRDEYAWLRDANWPNVTDSKILDYLHAENAYVDKFYAPLKYKYDAVFAELKSRVRLDDQSPYEMRDDWLYYKRAQNDKQYPIYCRKFGNAEAPEEVILDVNEIAKEQKYTSVQAVSVSPDHAYLAYTVDHVGNEKFVAKIMDLTKRSYLPEEIRDIDSTIVWHEKIPGFFYLPVNENMRKDKVFFHPLHRDGQSDKFVFGITDHLYMVYAKKSSSRKYIFFDVSGHANNEIYALDITTENEEFHAMLIKEKSAYDGVFYDVTHAGNEFYIRTNDEGAKNYKVIAAPENKPSNWNRTYIAESETGYLKKIQATKTYLITKYSEAGLPVIKLKRFTDGAVKSIVFPDASYHASPYSTNYALDDVRVSYSSLSRPETIYKYDYNEGKLTVLKAPHSITGFNSDEYNVEFIRVPSGSVKGKGGSGNDDDNEEIVSIPATVFYKKSLFRKDGTNPAYLYGYGSYGSSVPAAFQNAAISLADRGFVYVIAHVRGGDELGQVWYESAKFLKKKRTFRDFIAVAEGLISRKYAKTGNIAVCGRSAGGMLIGAVLNERPDLFKAAVATVPFVDVLHTMLDESLPLTPLEFKEWGNPKDKEYFTYMKSYSPYENVKRQPYPNILVTAALSDIRVGYWEAAKWVARLRKFKTDGNVLLLKTDVDSGHLSLMGRFDYLKQITDKLVFIFKIFEV